MDTSNNARFIKPGVNIRIKPMNPPLGLVQWYDLYYNKRNCEVTENLDDLFFQPRNIDNRVKKESYDIYDTFAEAISRTIDENIFELILKKRK